MAIAENLKSYVEPRHGRQKLQGLEHIPNKKPPGVRAADVTRATGVTASKFNIWLDRGLIRTNSKDETGTGYGRPRSFSLQTAHRVGLAHELTKIGMQPSIALELANRLVGDEPQHGRVLIAATRDGGTVIDIAPDMNPADFLHEGAAVLIDIGAIINRINSRLQIGDIN